jgi:hypothetical protein
MLLPLNNLGGDADEVVTADPGLTANEGEVHERIR